jgi:hypothetical protein
MGARMVKIMATVMSKGITNLVGLFLDTLEELVAILIVEGQLRSYGFTF